MCVKQLCPPTRYWHFSFNSLHGVPTQAAHELAVPLDESRTDMDPSRHHPYVLHFSFEGPVQRGPSLVIYIVQRAFVFCPDQMVKRSKQEEDAAHCFASELTQPKSDCSLKVDQIKEIHLVRRMKTYFGKRPPHSYFSGVWSLREKGGNATFQGNKEAKSSKKKKKSNAFVNLYEFHLNCYGIKLNPMHGCSWKSCRDISVLLMVAPTPSRRGWEAVPLRTSARFKWF